jgi:hypothetical protein
MEVVSLADVILKTITEPGASFLVSVMLDGQPLGSYKFRVQGKNSVDWGPFGVDHTLDLVGPPAPDDPVVV